ncbi:MAG: class I SAM-dependent methyltransferase [Flavisolibacter sp.]
MKDLFSDQSKIYAAFRPNYPTELYEYILQFMNDRKHAWDCATGNGQAAVMLANYFEKIEASDISEAQISNAIKKDNIKYHICPAEQTPFPDNSFDLITVAQAYHWFNWKRFYDEATRVGKKGAVVAIWMYNMPSTDDEKVNKIIRHFYRDITGPYWDKERKYVDEEYRTVEFDFNPLPAKEFQISFNWKREQLKGYFQSWSAVQKFIKENNSNPGDLVEEDIDAAWNETEEKRISFPIFLRIGRIRK